MDEIKMQKTITGRKEKSFIVLHGFRRLCIYTKHSAASDVFTPFLLSLVNEKEAAKEQREHYFHRAQFHRPFFGKISLIYREMRGYAADNDLRRICS